MRIWVEIRTERNVLGNDVRDEWAYGKVLWSPTTSRPTSKKIGSKIYELMREPKIGDRVIHFYETGGIRYFHANSKVTETCSISTERPSDPGTWEWAKEFFRIGIGDFKLLKEPINLSSFAKSHDLDLRKEIIEDDPPNYPFQIKRYKDPKFKIDSEVSLKQGKYIQECSSKLFTLLTEIEEIEISNEPDSKLSSREEFVEGKRKERETYFFSRNPQLVREAKRVFGYKCQACGFEFKEKYGEFGKDYIECHHENVLSERPENEWEEEVKTSLNAVKVLCSNCHRMIHHKRPALTFDQLLQLLR